MPAAKTIFRKTVLKPGSFLVNTPSGERKVVTFTKDYIAQTAKTAKEMLADGHLIPAPYGHTDSKGVHPTPLTRSEDKDNPLLDSITKLKPKWDQAANSGYWTDFQLEEDDSLTGILEADGDSDNPETHAGRIGKTYRQTSPLLLEEFTDGTGKKRIKAPLHICVTNKAVAPNQDEFTKVESDNPVATAMAIDLDSAIGENGITLGGNLPADSPGTVKKIKELLKQKLDIELPGDTGLENFHDRLLTVLTSLKPKNSEEEGIDFNEPTSQDRLTAPLIMSDDATQDSVAVHPGLLKLAEANVKQSFKTRVESLISKGQIGRPQAEKVLLPQVEAFTMSLDDVNDDGTTKQTALEMAIATLEQNDSLTDTNVKTELPSGSEDPVEPDDMKHKVEEVSEEDIDKTLSSIFPQSLYPTQR